MQEFPFKYLPFIDYVKDQPHFVVMWAAFGVPLLMFVLLIISNIYKNSKYAKTLNTIIFSSVFFTWLAGFLITIILLFSGISGTKLYLIWISLFGSSLIFTVVNNKSLTKLYDSKAFKKFEQ